MIWCGSTEVFLQPRPSIRTEIVRKSDAKNDADIAPSMIYAYAALM